MLYRSYISVWLFNSKPRALLSFVHRRHQRPEPLGSVANNGANKTRPPRWKEARNEYEQSICLQLCPDPIAVLLAPGMMCLCRTCHPRHCVLLRACLVSRTPFNSCELVPAISYSSVYSKDFDGVFWQGWWSTQWTKKMTQISRLD